MSGQSQLYHERLPGVQSFIHYSGVSGSRLMQMPYNSKTSNIRMMHAATHRATKPLKHTLIIHPKNLNGRQITHQISVNGKNSTLNISASFPAYCNDVHKSLNISSVSGGHRQHRTSSFFLIVITRCISINGLVSAKLSDISLFQENTNLIPPQECLSLYRSCHSFLCQNASVRSCLQTSWHQPAKQLAFHDLPWLSGSM